MATFSSGLNPDVVKTALDGVVYQEYEKPAGPEEANAESSEIFKQSSTDRAAVILEVFKGVGFFQQRAEQQDLPSDAPLIGDMGTYNVLNFSKSVDITKNFFDDAQFDAVQEMMTDFGNMARVTRDNEAMGIYRNAFTTTLTVDGASLISDSHTTLSGATVDNKITTALADSSLNTAITMLYEQKSQAGVIRGHRPNCLLVPAALYKTAVVLTDSVLRPGTANNDLNVYSMKYGITVKQSPYLGAAAGGSDTAWFLLSDKHNVYRWVRQGLVTNLVPYQYQRNYNYIYSGEYRETTGAVTYEGIIGSTGLA